MVGRLLIRGMLVGALAGLLCFGFLKAFGEPALEAAIAFETRMDAAQDASPASGMQGMATPARTMPGMVMPGDGGGDLVSRGVQASLGLFVGVMVYSASFGGLFAIAFAFAYRRVGAFGPRATAAILAAMAFVSVTLVPSLKYPANPPAVGEPETIGARTGLYFSMIALSLAAMIAAGFLRKGARDRLGDWNASLLAGGIYVLAMAVAAFVLPVVNEVPEGFPAATLWQFRLTSVGAQALLWTVIGLAFGVAAERLLEPASSRLGTAARV